MTKEKGQDVEQKAQPAPAVSARYPFLGGWFDRWPFPSRIPELWAQLNNEGIPVEEFVDDDTLVIRAELPGVDADEDIDIDVENGVLSIRARREQREEAKEEDSFRSEFHYGSFRRSMVLPSGADADDVKATYTDGILEVRVPVDGEQPARTKIPVSRS